MSYVDLAFSVGIFILFFGITMMLIVSFFLKESTSVNVEEYREKATSLFSSLFSSEGAPANWEDSNSIPSELGLIRTIYRTPIIVQEGSGVSRTNEPVIEKVQFDGACAASAYNSTIRLYDDNMTSVNFNIIGSVMCPDGFVNESYMEFLANVSSGQSKKYWLYYYNDTGIPTAFADLTVSTSRWLPNSGDSWTEATSDWARYGGASGSVSASANRTMGSYSIGMTDTFSSGSAAGLQYNPASLISASNYPYISAWIHVDSLASTSVNVSVNNGTDTVYASIDDMEAGSWYYFRKDMTSMDGVPGFNHTYIDYVRFYMVNSTAAISRTITVDGMHFEMEPLDADVYPAQNVSVVSGKKVSALSNFTFDELKKVLGEDYKFRVEISRS